MRLLGLDCRYNFMMLVYIASLFVQMTSELGSCDRVLFGWGGGGGELRHRGKCSGCSRTVQLKLFSAPVLDC